VVFVFRGAISSSLLLGVSPIVSSRAPGLILHPGLLSQLAPVELAVSVQLRAAQ